ncbi:MAG TPA: type II toxin-antitoxin system PemK/MazF family toxin [Acidimicrobiia bacterium]|nr:type II toxin-antitoxin system PemK/MazF family toxin [Acidimicrobiia bacterium]
MILTIWPRCAACRRRWRRSVRGDIHRLRSDRQAKGREQRGARLAVVLQSDHLPLSTVVVAPTSTVARSADFRPEIVVDGSATKVLIEQLAAVDLSRLGELVGTVSPQERLAIDEALRDLLAV